MPGIPGIFLSARSRGPEACHDALTHRFDQIEHLLEPAVSAVVRIGYFAAGVIGMEIAEQPELVFAAGRAQRLKQRMIAAIHCDNVVEFVEIPSAYLASAQLAHVVAAPARRVLGAVIRRLADVVIVRAGRVAFDEIIQPGFAHRAPEHCFGSR